MIAFPFMAIRFCLNQPIETMGFRIEENADQIEIEIPATAIDQLHYRLSSAGDSFVISDDLRTLYQPSDSVDENAIYSLLQFGAVIPPLSPWKQIRRVAPGAITTFSKSSVEEPGVRRVADRQDIDGTDATEEQIDKGELTSEIVSHLDAVLLGCKDSPVIILFSGGVDSGILAARAAAIGLDVTLVNYCFGKGDQESLHAERMAQHLGLKFTRIYDSGSEIEDVLDHAAQYYRIPFVDHSTLPTSALIRSVIKRFNERAIVFDGTGADGAFGLFGKAKPWQRISSLPRTLRNLGAATYKLTRAYVRNNELEFRLRLLRRSAQLEYPLVAVAQNPLEGIAFHASPIVKGTVDHLAMHWVSYLSDSDPRRQIAALDLALVCSAIFAQKSKSLYAGTSLEVVYPFLSPAMIRLAYKSLFVNGLSKQPKALLKAALARHVPQEMVYRTKSGFVAPIEEKFKQKAFLGAFDNLLKPGAPLHEFVDSTFLRMLRPRLVEGKPLPSQTGIFIWGAVFVNEWLAQMQTLRTFHQDKI